MNKCNFSFKHYKEILSLLRKNDYTIYSCESFISKKRHKKPFIILRHDVEYFPSKALEFALLEYKRRIKSSYFFRVHAKEYNLYNYKIYKLLHEISNLGHEIGLHTENLDFSFISGEKAEEVIKKEKLFLELLLESRIVGISPHRDFTSINNLDFWKKYQPSNFGFEYQAYEKRFFDGIVYASDSLGKWKIYTNINSAPQKISCLCSIVKEKQNIYALIHPRTWYHKAYFLED